MDGRLPACFRVVAALVLPALALGVVAGAQGSAAGPESFQAAADALVNATFRGGDDSPGGTVIVVKDGSPAYRAARGMASLELGVRMQPDSVLRIGSVTKQFTSAAVMILVEQGRLALDDEITRFLPDYPVQGRHITLEHLLTHTSGIRSYTSLPAWPGAWGRDFTTAGLVDFFKNEPMEFEPGERYLYNNSAYFLLGAIIQKVSGVAYPEFLARNIFTPLGMTRTRDGDTGPVVKGRAQGYQLSGGVIVNAPYLSMTQPGAAGALISTVDDLARWDAAIGAGKLLEADSWRRIFTPYRLTNGKSTGYGYGWQVGSFEGRTVQEHGGGIHGFSAYVVRLPDDRVYAAVLANSTTVNTGALARKLAALAAGRSLVDPQPIALTPEKLAEYVGVYQFDDDVKVTVAAAPGGGLSVQAGGRTPTPIVPMASDRFFVRDSFTRYAFERDTAGTIVGLIRTTFSGVDAGKRVGG